MIRNCNRLDLTGPIFNRPEELGEGIMNELMYQIDSSIALVGEDGVGKFTIAKNLCEPYHTPRSAGRGPSRYIFKDKDLRDKILSCYRGLDDLNLHFPERCGLLVVTPAIAGSISQDTNYERHEVLYKLIKNLVHLGVEDFIFVLTHIDKLPKYKEKEGQEKLKKTVNECQEKLKEFINKNHGKINFHCDYVPLFKNEDGVVANINFSELTEELKTAGYPEKCLLDAIKHMIEQHSKDNKQQRHPGWMNATVVSFPQKKEEAQEEGEAQNRQPWALLPKHVARRGLKPPESEGEYSAYIYKDKVEALQALLRPLKYLYTTKEILHESLTDGDEVVLLEDLSLSGKNGSMPQRYYSTQRLQVSLNQPDIWEREKNDISLEATLFGAQRCPCRIEDLKQILTRDRESEIQWSDWSVKLSMDLVASKFSQDVDAGRILIRRRRADGSMEPLDVGRILEIVPFDLLLCLRYFLPMRSLLDTTEALKKDCEFTHCLLEELSGLIHKVFSGETSKTVSEEIEKYRQKCLNCSESCFNIGDLGNAHVQKFNNSTKILCDELRALRNKKKQGAKLEATETAFKDTISGFLRNPIEQLCSHVIKNRPETESIISVSNSGLFAPARDSGANDKGTAGQKVDSLNYYFKCYTHFDNVYWVMDELFHNIQKHGPEVKKAWVFVDRPRTLLKENIRIWVIDNGVFDYPLYKEETPREGLRTHVTSRMAEIGGRLHVPNEGHKELNTAIGLEFPVCVIWPRPQLLGLEEVFRLFWEKDREKKYLLGCNKSLVTNLRESLVKLNEKDEEFNNNQDPDFYTNTKKDKKHIIEELVQTFERRLDDASSDSERSSNSFSDSMCKYIRETVFGLGTPGDKFSTKVAKTLTKQLDQPLEWIVEDIDNEPAAQNNRSAGHVYENPHQALLVKDSFVWFKDNFCQYLNISGTVVEYPKKNSEDPKGKVSLTLTANDGNSHKIIQEYVRLWRTRLFVLDIESETKEEAKEDVNKVILDIYIPLLERKK